MPTYPSDTNDTVLYTGEDIFVPKDSSVTVFEDARMFLYGEWYLNGESLGSGQNKPFVDSADFLLVGDGVADDTAALQTFLNTQPKKTHLLRNSPVFSYAWEGAKGYRTTSTLVIPDCPGYRLCGENRLHTVIEADFNNAPILKTFSENIHNYIIENVMLKFKTPQPVGNTNAVGFLVDGPTEGPSGGCQNYYSTLRNMMFDGCCIGYDVTKPPGRYNGTWNVVFDTLHFNRTSKHLIRLQSSGGQPINTLRMITAIGAQGNNSQALYFEGCEFSIQGLDIEDWNGPIMYAPSGNGFIDGIHIERHVLSSDYQALFLFTDGSFTFQNYSIDFAASSAVGTVIVQMISQGSLNMGNGNINLQRLTTANSVALLRTDDGPVSISLPVKPLVMNAAGIYHGAYYYWENTPKKMTTLTLSAPWDIPSTPIGGMATVEHDLWGAIGGDIVGVSTELDLPAGVQLTGNVPAPNKVRITLVNHSDAVFDPGGQYVKVRIWKNF